MATRQIKGRRRQMARKMIIQRIHRDVPKADVIVTNPTELAIALKYDPDSMGAPRVVAKGAGFLAARIRQIAIQNGVPIMERKPLAQALYKTVEVGSEVPPEFYQTIAEILAYVYELSGQRHAPTARSAELSQSGPATASHFRHFLPSVDTLQSGRTISLHPQKVLLEIF